MKIAEILKILLITIILIFLIISFQGLVIWGIGSFVCWAFEIDFIFTFWHGIAIALLLSLLEDGVIKITKSE